MKVMMTSQSTINRYLIKFHAATMRILWERNNTKFHDCGEAQILRWLKIQDQLFADVPMLSHVAVVHMEHFVGGDTQGLIARTC